MRFSHFLKYNAVPEWQNHYLDYVALKNLIYTLQSDELNHSTDNTSAFNETDRIEEIPKGIETTKTASAKDLTSKIKSTFFKAKNEEYIPDKIDKNTEFEETIELDDNPLSVSKLGRPLKNIFSTNLKPQPNGSPIFCQSGEKTTSNSSYDVFLASLINERTKIDDFYKRMEAKFYEKFDSLLTDLETENITSFEQIASRLDSTTSNIEIIRLKLLNNNNKRKSNNYFNVRLSHDGTELRNRFDLSEEEFDEDEEVEYGIDGTQENSALLNYSQVNIKSQKRSILKQSIIYLYIDLCQLKSFIELNSIGFSKITKKFDKVLHMSTRSELIDSGIFFKDIYTFKKSTLNDLNQRIKLLVEFYALETDRSDDLDSCKKELKSFLHDHIVWERSKTWKDMLGLVSTDEQIRPDLDIVEKDDNEKREKLNINFYLLKLPRPIEWKFIHISYISVPKLFFTKKVAKLAFIITFTGVLLGVKTFNDRIEGRCMALVECVALLWASEAIPLHITAFLVPLLTVLFKVLKNDDGKAMGAADASSVILASMWSSTIMILLAGFTLGEALSQYDIARIIASWLLSAAGTKPRNVILMAMAVVFFLSMWISNVASPVLTYSLLTPLLDPLDSDTPFAKALVMGVALAADIGGMASPISSPQNIISMNYLKPYSIGWGQFFAVALPCGILATLCSWGIMCTTFKINTTKLEKFTPIRTKLTIKQWYVIVVSVGTILLWCVESKIEGVFGSSGQIAVLPIVLFFGTGLLTTKDINSFPWHIVILAMGGLALGKAVSSSGLLTTIARALQRRIENDELLAILCIFGILMLVVGTFVSHTVSAIIIVPLVQEVGEKLDNPKAAPILVFGCALLSSCGMGLASSGFPNVTAISLTDKKGNRYLDVLTFLTRGVPASLSAFVCIITLGYGIMISIVKSVSQNVSSSS